MDIEERMDDRVNHSPIVAGSADDLKEDNLLSHARNNFIKKVYTILGIQLMVTTAFVVFNMTN